jgi:hypothetical protein
MSFRNSKPMLPFNPYPRMQPSNMDIIVKFLEIGSGIISQPGAIRVDIKAIISIRPPSHFE